MENRIAITRMRIKCILLFALRIWLCWWSVRGEAQGQAQSTVVWTEVNGEAELPCQVSTPAGDKINMVLWFKDQTGIPIYSFDARGVETTNGIHMALSNLEKRCSFTPSDFKGGSLRIFRITNNDAGLYKCRVDFSNSPTQQFKVTLAIAELPSMPVILTPMGSDADNVVGPYDEDDSFELTCIVNGGNPTPQISWWIDGEPLYGYMKESGSKVSSHLIVHSVRRGYNGKYLECRVNVTGVSNVLSQRVRLKIYVKPIAVSIVNGNNVISDGESAKFVCDCFGSNPPADIAWLLDGEPIRSSAITVMHANTTTTSTLTIRADPTFNNKSLLCKCENIEFPGYYLQDRKTLQVHYRPLVQIVSRPKFNFNKIKEGDNVSLECAINANPPANEIRWFHDGKLVDSENKVMYYLRAVSLSSQGEYECEAANMEGLSRSPKLSVNILHAPYCQEGFENQTVMAAVLETVILQCEVEAGPTNRHVQFYWTLNNTRRIENLANHQIQSLGKSSILKYTPEADDDFGLIACWAQNDVGPQRVPCFFRLSQANKPDRPRNCWTNSTSEELQITCEPGYDGGLKQFFVLEVRLAPNSSTSDSGHPVVEQLNDQAASSSEIKTIKLLRRMQKENPVFNIVQLDIGTPYLLTLYAVNLKGKSEPVVLTPETRPATNIVSSEISATQDSHIVPSIYIIIMALIVLTASLVIITAIILACRTQRTSRRENFNELNNFHIVYPEPDENKRLSRYESEF